MEAIKEDVQENKGRVATIYKTIFGDEKGPGMQAKVESNSLFIKEMKLTSRTVLFVVLGEAALRLMGLI